MKKDYLTILQLNDSHAYFELHQELFWQGKNPHHAMAGGYARISAVIEKIKEETRENLLIFDCGDTIHGTFAAVNSEGKSLIPILNHMAFDAMTAHWEFAYGPEKFKKLVKKLNYPMLAINCYDERNDKLVFPPYTILEVNDLKIGVIGIAATIVDKVMPPSFSKGIYFTLGKHELPHYVDLLKNKEEVDLIIVLSHLGFPQEVQLAEEVEGIDVILSSHTHNRLYRPALINQTIIIQSGCHGSFLGRLDLELGPQGVRNFAHQLITISESIQPHEDVNELVEKAIDPHRDYLNQIMGETTTPLNRNTVLEATMDNFLLKAILKAIPGDMAFSNGWRYGAPVPPGPITMNDLWNIIPVNPPISQVELTGREIWTMMEENLERTFSSDPYQQMGGYVKRCQGINVYFKIENPYGHRIQEIFVQGKKLEPDRVYTATYITSQGVPSNYGQKHQVSEIKAIDALEKYLNRLKKVESPLEGRVIAV